MRSCKSQEGLINMTHNEAARKIWLLLSHIVANYTETFWDLTGVTTGHGLDNIAMSKRVEEKKQSPHSQLH